MSDTIEVDDAKYNLNGNPSLRTVRHVQNMQMDMIMDYVDEDDLKEMDSIENESEIIQAIIDTGGYQALQDVMWEKSMLEPVQTISLAADNVFNLDDFDDLPALNFKDFREKSEDALDGDASDFFKELGIGSFLSEEEMSRRASNMVAAQNET